MGNKLESTLALMGNTPEAKDRWAELQNKGGAVNFNVAKAPYNVWGGQYTQIRPRGATYAHPEGIDAAFEAEKQKYPGILGLLSKQK
jgi:hypothetical protein